MTMMKNKIIVALDVDSAEEAALWAHRLKDKVGMFKIGKQLFTAAGPDIVRRVRSEGGEVFLDLKYHDIPNTVAAAAVEAVRLGASMFNVHASGGFEMMSKTAEAVRDEAERLDIKKPVLIAVTVLTSMNEEGLRETGVTVPLTEHVINLAKLAKKAGLDGVVASPHEIEAIKNACGSEFVVVTPGVRPTFASKDDQRRIMTPAEAVKKGADYLVIGRPITKADDPIEAVSLITEEICQE
ncbi:MAG: orotidine-5'-phosphate decarboxylase [Proteobacteria bacterium]|nr:orotidine-5'-phosphate decarboxylase [Pseudomonadota bacterium]